MSRSSRMSGVAVQRVVVEVHLRVEREQVAALGDDQRVDLEDRRVGRDEGVVERQHHLDALLERVAGQAERERRASAPRTAAGRRAGLMKTLWIFSGCSSATFSISTPPSLLTIRTMRFDGAIEDEPEIQLAIDGEAFFDQQARHPLAVGTGLIGDQRLAEQLARDRLGLGARLGELDAAGLAAAAGVNLRLDDRNGSAEALGDVVNFFGCERHFPAGDRHAVFREDCFGLVLVNLHEED